MSDAEGGASRRDFVTISAGVLLALGAAAALWPAIDQMNPNAGTPPPETASVDLTAIAPGQTKTISWRGKPVFIRHRTQQEIEQAREVLITNLIDPLARNAMLPEKALATDANRTLKGHENWLVVVGLCTHMGCVLKDASEDAARAFPGECWFCPCHAARFDSAGRVRGGPALTNLPVPPFQIEKNKLVIG